MLILAIVVLGVFAGWLANIILGGGSRPKDWGELAIAGFAGSFVGGLLVSLLAGDGIRLRPSGIIGSILGAIIVLVIMRFVRKKTAPPPVKKSRSGNPAKRR
jgi:uncharacterized membrane protein YeaQ/YmgE (transglycosylase-associated protein family)